MSMMLIGSTSTHSVTKRLSQHLHAEGIVQEAAQYVPIDHIQVTQSPAGCAQVKAPPASVMKLIIMKHYRQHFKQLRYPGAKTREPEMVLDTCRGRKCSQRKKKKKKKKEKKKKKSLSHRAATDSTQTPREITQSAAGLSSQKIKRKRRERRTDRVWRRRWSLRKSPSPSSEAPPFRGSALGGTCVRTHLWSTTPVGSTNGTLVRPQSLALQPHEKHVT
ncbi:hypothetical protein ACER0C_031673 [Sarotherodon galilaeus]